MDGGRITGVLGIMNLSLGNIVFLSFIALIVAINLIRFFCYYVILLKLLSKQPEEKNKLLNSKYKFIFSKDWFKNDELEYRRIQAREAIKAAIVFCVGFVMAFYMFAFYGK